MFALKHLSKASKGSIKPLSGLEQHFWPEIFACMSDWGGSRVGGWGGQDKQKIKHQGASPVGTGPIVMEPCSLEILLKGWGVPTATDISLAWMFALLIFGAFDIHGNA